MKKSIGASFSSRFRKGKYTSGLSSTILNQMLKSSKPVYQYLSSSDSKLSPYTVVKMKKKNILY